MSSSTTAVRAGRAFIELAIRDKGVDSALGRMQQRFAGAAKKLALVGAAGVAAGAAVLGPIGALSAAVLDRGAEFGRLATIYGGTAEEMSKLAYAAEASGSSLEEFKSAMENLPERIADAAAGGGEAAEAFEEMGLNAAELVNLSPAEQLDRIADAFQRIDPATQKAGKASKLFSDVGLQLLPMLKDGSAGLRRYAEDAERVGAVVSDEDAANSAKTLRALNDAYKAAKYTLLEFGAAILPQAETFKNLSRSFTYAIQPIREFIKQNRSVIFAVLSVAAGVAAAGAVLLGLGAAAAAVSFAIGAIVPVLLAIKAAFLFTFAAITSPVGLAVIAIVGLGAVLIGLSDTAAGWAADIVAYFTESLGTVKETFAGVSDALAAGDLALAGRVAMAGLEVEFRRGVMALTDLWNGFKAFFVDGWHDAVMLVELAWNEASGAVGDTFLSLMQLITQQFEGTIAKVFALAADAVEALGMASGELRMFQELAEKGQLSGVVADARKGLGKDTQANSFKITNDAQDAQRQRDAARAGDAAEARADLERARGNLASLNEQAAALKEMRKEKPLPPGAKLPNGQAIAAVVRGQFGGELAGQSLGGSRDIPAKQLKEQEKTNAKLDELKTAFVDAAANGGFSFT